ncbi:hypothetical protein AALP_AA5G090400 [Arabis alpina]|uniref:Uncharacterized protein n=1 Tax=Arabis alpina TaxID=50452 RepID=A0A087GVV8_ARAAL|nr:hypothetical protein AALP_AA5G090400 [Arabis alpina]
MFGLSRFVGGAGASSFESTELLRWLTSLCLSDQI